MSTFPFLPSPRLTATFRYRGLYVESKWGPDLMTLDDWRGLVDEMAALQMNSLGIGVYGCWVVQYGGQRTEFLMVPFPEHPKLQTPKTIGWYSPAARAEQSLTYLPRMFEQDFFGEVVAYGREQGIAVRPHFNGPGHTTLIPTVYPEVSAQDEHGAPTGFGYCLTAEKTYDLLFSLYDSLIERHLRPHGGTWWHMGLDEVNAYAGIDARDLGRPVDPWCKCPQCAQRSQSQRLVDFAVRTIQHLTQRGIEQITLWNDALQKLNAYPLFCERLAALGLAGRVAVQWWRYGDPPLPVQERQLRSWVTPMAGYWSNLFHHDYGPNIHAMAAEGLAAGSEGLDAYCIYDPAYFRNYAFLARLGLEARTELNAFRGEFAGWLFGRGESSDGPAGGGAPPATAPAAGPTWESSSAGMRGRTNPAPTPPAAGPAGDQAVVVPPAFDHFDTLFDSSYGPLGSYLDSLLLYWWTYPAQRHVSYPRDQVAQLASDPLRATRALGAARRQAEELRDACRDALAHAPDERRRRLLREYACEANKLAGVVNAFLLAANGWRSYRQAQRGPTRAEMVDALTRAQAAFQSARQTVEDVMRELEQVKAPFLRPHTLRDLTPLYAWLARAHDRVRDLRAQVEAAGLDDLPPLE